MAKHRYLIELSGDDVLPYFLTTVRPDGESQGGLGSYSSVDAAKAAAQRLAQSGDEDTWGESVELVWKDPPAQWQPDAITVSQYLEDMYPDLPA